MLVYELTFNSELDFEKYLLDFGLHPEGAKIISNKLSRYTLRIDKLKGVEANILKQECLSIGADCAAPSQTLLKVEEYFPVIITATHAQIEKLTTKLEKQTFKNLRELSIKLTSHWSLVTRHEFAFNKKKLTSPLVMGILNTTPDSFSDGGNYFNVEEAFEQAKQMVQEGANIIDVGGESSRPGAEEVSVAEELRRVIPVIKKIADNLDVVISIDTTKSEVALEAVRNGAQVINDISGLTRDPKIATVAADHNCYLVLMHRSADSLSMQGKTDYDDLIPDILDSLLKSAAKALSGGVDPGKIIVDPGIGFGKKVEQNLELVKQIGAFRSLGFPVLLGTSRKSFMGAVLGEEDPSKRDIATAATSIHGIINGVSIMRVHDIGANIDALKMIKALKTERGN